jgi:hypothetical protein
MKSGNWIKGGWTDVSVRQQGLLCVVVIAEEPEERFSAPSPWRPRDPHGASSRGGRAGRAPVRPVRAPPSRTDDAKQGFVDLSATRLRNTTSCQDASMPMRERQALAATTVLGGLAVLSLLSNG